jgi:hypothetical protein
MEQTEYSETLAYKIQTPGNYPEENTLQEICFSKSPDRPWGSPIFVLNGYMDFFLGVN